MGFFADLFGSPPPKPITTIKNVLGETLLEVPARDLIGSTCLRVKDLSHASLQGQSFDGSDLENVNFFGADLRNCSFDRCNLKNANLAYALIEGASFQQADLDGVDLLHTNIRLAQLDGANITPTSNIPGIRVVSA
jgi:uncharacterized protein YjbI with pentapeptide repeats